MFIQASKREAWTKQETYSWNRKERVNLRHLIQANKILHKMSVVGRVILIIKWNEIDNFHIPISFKTVLTPTVLQSAQACFRFSHCNYGHPPFYAGWNAKSAYGINKTVTEAQNRRTAWIFAILSLVNVSDRFAIYRRERAYRPILEIVQCERLEAKLQPFPVFETALHRELMQNILSNDQSKHILSDSGKVVLTGRMGWF